MANKVIALFVEGPTEIAFYKAVIKRAHDLLGHPFECNFEWIDMKGIGNYKDIALRKFERTKKKYPEKEIYAFLCIDLDVFSLSKKPPLDRQLVATRLKEAGAKKVTYIIAKQSIEDWFLSDMDGIISYLRLPQDTKRPAGKGQDALKRLFKSANKIYVKGGETKGFIEKLNITTIMVTHCESLKPLCQCAGLDCNKICR